MDQPADVLIQRAASLFNLLDPNGTGFVTLDDLRNCIEASPSSRSSSAFAGETGDHQLRIEDVFQRLDTDGDGRIDLDDFQLALKAISCQQAGPEVDQESQDPEDANADVLPVICGAEELACHEEVQQMQRLLVRQYPQLADSFQGVMETVAMELSRQRRERQELETSLQRSADLALQRTRQLQEEMEQQLAGFEQQARARERQRLQDEFQRLAAHQQDEVARLQARMSELRCRQDATAESESARAAAEAAQQAAASAKADAERLARETQQLEAELAKCQAGMSLARRRGDKCEATLKAQRRQVAEEAARRQELDGRLAEMRAVNARLRLANEELRRALFNGSRLGRRCARRRLRQASGGSTAEASLHSMRRSSTSAGISVESELLSAAGDDDASHRELFDDELDGADSEWDVASRTSTARSLRPCTWQLNANEETLPPLSPASSSDASSNYTPTIALSDWSDEERQQAAGIPLADELAAAALLEPRTVRHRRTHRQQRIRNRRLLLRAGGTEADFDSVVDVGESQPERLFKIVTAGDPAVGKTSFVGCFCDGSCPPTTRSTVGIDFKTRTMVVDGHVVAIQLWDTAGQERFRSLAKSYFRRADGALLIYDCTDESSFVSVREWLLAIREGSDSEIPVMLVANKIDARETARSRGSAVVDTEAGHQLSRDAGALFAEASAATGENVPQAVATLTRVLLLQQDLAIGNSLSIHLRRTSATKEGGGDVSSAAWLRKGGNCCRTA